MPAIAYFDTSALIPSLIDEPGSSAWRLWDDADDGVSVRLTYVETAAALSQARRLGRLTSRRQQAAQVADQFALPGYNAVHCAAAVLVNDETLVAAVSDQPK